MFTIDQVQYNLYKNHLGNTVWCLWPNKRFDSMIHEKGVLHLDKVIALGHLDQSKSGTPGFGILLFN